VHTRARYRRPGRSGCCGAELWPQRRMRRDGAGRAFSACGNGSAAALAWPEGVPTDTRFMRRAGSTRTRTRCRRTSRTATAAASTRRGSARLLLRASRRVHGCVAETSRSVRRLWPKRAPAAGVVHVPMAMHRACMRTHTRAR
jgi:hypothetical protein